MALNEKNKYEKPEDIKLRQFKQAFIVVCLLILLIFLTVVSEMRTESEEISAGEDSLLPDTESQEYQDLLKEYGYFFENDNTNTTNASEEPYVYVSGDSADSSGEQSNLVVTFVSGDSSSGENNSGNTK